MGYLGHVISGKGVKMEAKKVIVIGDWPLPRSVKALRGFLGLTIIENLCRTMV